MGIRRRIASRACIAGAAWLLVAAGCTATSSAGDSATSAATDAAAPTAAVAADFEGTLQVLELALEADAVRKVVGSTDPGDVMAFPPEKLVDAALSGGIQASAIRRSTLEIDGRMARWQGQGESFYMVIDGRAGVVHLVTPDTAEITTMDPARMAAAATGGSATGAGIEPLGRREIRGFDADGYRVPGYMGGSLALWLSPELEAVTGPVFDVWLMLNPPGRDPGRGMLVRSVMVNPDALAGGGSGLPAYTVAEFHDPRPGPVAEERMALPDGYRKEVLQ